MLLYDTTLKENKTISGRNRLKIVLNSTKYNVFHADFHTSYNTTYAVNSNLFQLFLAVEIRAFILYQRLHQLIGHFNSFIQADNAINSSANLLQIEIKSYKIYCVLIAFVGQKADFVWPQHTILSSACQ